VTILVEEQRSVRELPVNYRAEDAALFEHERTKLIPSASLLTLRGVSASADGMLFRHGRVLDESFSAAHVREAFRKSPWRVLKFLVKNHLFRRRRRHAVPSLWVTDDWSSGYFHWVGDVLPRLFAARDVARELVLLLPSGFDELPFVRSSLPLFDLGGVDFIGAKEVRVCEQLVLPTHTSPSGHYNDPLMRDLRDFILARLGLAADRPTRRVYISRGGSSRRRIANEADVMELFGRFDFEVVRFEHLAFEEQVRIATQCRVLAGNHGAGLVNMLFMPAGAKVLELRRTGDRYSNCFFSLASTAGLRYYYQTCDSVLPGSDPHFGDIVVDTDQLRRTLTSMED
jgi:capsular polysaccharide biosynthesis protein